MECRCTTSGRKSRSIRSSRLATSGDATLRSAARARRPAGISPRYSTFSGQYSDHALGRFSGCRMENTATSTPRCRRACSSQSTLAQSPPRW